MKPRLLTRAPLLALTLLALLAALWGGLVRLGWSLPAARLAAAHGPLMVSGFLGSLIALERAVALGRPWAYAVPLFNTAGAALVILGLPGSWGPLLIALGSLGFVGVSAAIVGQQRAVYTTTMGLGGVAWLVGNGLWLAGRPVAAAVPWWLGFLVLTIVGERLELSRVVQRSSRSHALFGLAVGLFSAGLLVSLGSFAAGVRLASLGLLALALWLGRYDVARRTVRRPGVTRFIAASLLLGYGWLAVGGLLGLRTGGATAGPAYDAWLHALALGFVFSMIFAHALLILPALSGLAVPFHPVLYGPTALLHLGLVLRLAGDLAAWLPGRQWGGLLNVVAVLWFFVTVAVLTIGARRAG